MKKIIAIACVIVILILPACNGKDKTDSSLSSEKSSIGTTIDDSKTEIISNNKENSNTTTTYDFISQNEKLTTEYTSEAYVSDENIHDVPPYILTESLEELRQIKYATETMDGADFSEYMDNNFSTEVVNGMDTLDNTKRLLSEMENTYIVFIDECDQDNTMAYYTESGDISYRVSADDEFYLCCRSYINSEKAFRYKEGDIVKYLGTYEANEIMVELYENSQDEKEGLYGNIRIDEQNIPFFTNIKISVKDFESVLSRIFVAKIGDLL